MKKIHVFKVGTALCLSLLIAPSFASAAALYRQLQVGSRGSDVTDLQTFLASDPGIYPEGTITGYFGSLTAAAVRRFQARNGIDQVGRVGPQTMAAINAQMNGTPSASGAYPVIKYATSTNNGSVAQFSIMTDMPTRASVFFSTSPITASENLAANPITLNISGSGVKTNDELATSHTVLTTQLTANTRYYYMVVVTNASGMVSVYPYSFVSGSF